MSKQPAKPIVPTDGLTIREDTRLEPGVYLLPAGLKIAADNITLDGQGATLIGHERRGTGILLDGHKNVTIRNVRLREYKHGIVARNGERLTLAANHITSTDEVVLNSIFLDIWTPPDQAYGAAILLERVTDSRVEDNDIQHQFAGLLSYHCARLEVLRNNASYNSGFGFHLYDTCDSVYAENWADYCNRYEPRDEGQVVVGAGSTGHMGADATGFLIIQHSCRNTFRRNFARCGGDGFFLAGRNNKGESVPCDDNVFEHNDASLSPNIAFEATFSRGNVFRHNWADRCNYGFWLGYGVEFVLEHNRLLFNRQAGVAAEHAVGLKIRHNDFQSNGHGVLGWTQFNKSYYESCPDRRSARDWLIEYNRFLRNGYAVAFRADRDHGIRPVAPERAGKPELRPAGHALRHNDIQDNRVGIHLSCADSVVIDQNKISANIEADLRLEDDSDTRIGHNLGLRGAYL